MRIDNDPKALVREVRKAGGPGCPVAVEATYGWYWAVDALLAARFEVHLAHPLGMKALRKRKRVKTDPLDAYELANLLRLGSLPEAYIAPPELRELRELVRHRRQLVKLSTAVKAGVRALLAKHNIRLAATDLDGDTAIDLMDALELGGTYAARLAGAAAAAAGARRRDRRHRGRAGPAAQGPSRLPAAAGVKGVGPVLAAVFVAEIGDVDRFPNAAALCCWAGITPRHYESDKTVRRGHISKEGCTPGPLGRDRGGATQLRTRDKGRPRPDHRPPRHRGPQHRQGRRRPGDARGRLLPAARRRMPPPHPPRRGVSTPIGLRGGRVAA